MTPSGRQEMDTDIRPPEELLTRRLRLRRPQMVDAPEIFERWTRDPDVTRYLVWTPHRDVTQAEDHIRRCIATWESGEAFVWLIETRADRSLIGSIAARP